MFFYVIWRWRIAYSTEERVFGLTDGLKYGMIRLEAMRKNGGYSMLDARYSSLVLLKTVLSGYIVLLFE